MSTPTAKLRQDYQIPSYLVPELELHFRLDPRSTKVTSTLHCQRHPKAAIDAPLALDGHHLKLLSLKINNVPVAQEDYQLSDEGLVLARVPEDFSLQIETEISPEHSRAPRTRHFECAKTGRRGGTSRPVCPVA